ncbi:uncharacterized protein LOC117343926 isoform X2 [Pecten maximus]|uniref:uncharacterized protein LOC117343926 isoform X2 n=1 Tax=Pecten maximus TaxID=6579 RepID=UPI0014589A7A|nr:uncharacterized protein LOC117343926 isoform X2 [Pecten maximus]
MSSFHKMTSGPEATVCLASMFTSSLGVRHGFKCVVDGDKELFLRSAFLVLQNLDIEHPVGQHLVTTCQSFHKRHGNGVKTLLFLIGSLMKMAVSQRENNIPVCDIVSAMQEGVKQCQKVMEEVRLPISDVMQSCDHCQCTLPSPNGESQPTIKQAPCEMTGGFSTKSGTSSAIPLHNDDTIQSTKSGTSAAIPLHNDDIIQLSLKENITEPEEDIDWFFEDDIIIHCLDNVNNTEVQGHARKSCLVNKNKTKSDNMEMLTVTQKSQCHSDDSDFDDCFDDVPVVNKFDFGKSDSQNTGTSRIPVSDTWNRSTAYSFDISKTRNSDLSGHLPPGQGHKRQESMASNIEDEFDSCFHEECDTNKTNVGTCSNEDPMKIKGQQVNGQGMLCPPDMGKYSSSASEALNKSLEMKIQDLLLQKTAAKQQEHKLVYNSSRHFKSVESTVNLLKLGKFNTDEKDQSLSVMAPSNQEYLGQPMEPQGQYLKYQDIPNEDAVLDKKESLQSLNKSDLPGRNMQGILDTKTQEKHHREGLGRKLDVLLGKARSKKVSGAMLQSRHFRELGQGIDNNTNIQSLETKDQFTKDTLCSNGERLRDGNDVTGQMSEAKSQDFDMQSDKSSEVRRQRLGMHLQPSQSKEVKSQQLGMLTCQSSEVKSQDLDNLALPGQSSEVKHSDKGSTSGHNELKSIEITDVGVVSDHGFINRDMVCSCAPGGEIDQWAGLRGVARSVSHHDEDMMDILVAAAMSQWRTDGCLDTSQARLTLELLYCCVTLGPITTPKLVSGVVIATDISNIPLVHQNKNRQLNTIMLNGDIKPSYHHIGYKRPLDVQKTITVQDFHQADRQSSWLNDVRDTLKKFSIMCLLVRGSICDEVKVICETLGVITIENVPYKALQVMCTASVSSMTTYLSDTNKTNVCTSVTLDTYNEKWMMGYQANFVKITCHKTPVQTCVVSHPTTGGGDLMEQDFWRCGNILSSLLSSGYVLPGGGSTEQLCSQALLASCGAVTEDDANGYLPHVLQDMAAVLHEYCITVNLNTGQGHRYPLPVKGQGQTDPPQIKGQSHENPTSKCHDLLKDSSPTKGQGHTDSSPIKGQGHTDSSPIKGQGHTDSPPNKGQGQTDNPNKYQGHTYPIPGKVKGQLDPSSTKGQGHIDHHPIKNTETDQNTSIGQTVFHKNKGQGHVYRGNLQYMYGDDSWPDFKSTGVHHSNSEQHFPSDMDIQNMNILEKNRLSHYSEQHFLEQRENTSVLFDDYKSKMAGIETACDFVSTVLMCDTYIVTGVYQTDSL